MSICPHCGHEYHPSEPDPNRGFVVCPSCGKQYSTPAQPLFFVTGVSASGKTTVAMELVGRVEPCLIIEGDDYGRVQQAFETSEDFVHYLMFLCKKLTHNCHPVAVFGWLSPKQIMASPRISLFTDVHILVLTCEPDELTARLEARFERQGKPRDADRIDGAIRANEGMKAEADAYDNATLLDTTGVPEEETISAVKQWILDRI